MIKIKMFDGTRIDELKDDFGWGTNFADHMIEMDYNDGEWGDVVIKKFEHMMMSPANCTLHYGQAIFEGQKAYKGKDGKIRLFRPWENLNRLNKSHERICIPIIPQEKLEDVLKSLKMMLEFDEKWILPEPNALYVRAFTIATENFVGIRPALTYKFMIITSPVPEYFTDGFKPIKLWIPENFVRAVVGGVGEAKVSGNYAAGMMPQKIAAEKGCQQVLFLRDGQYVTECNAMNFFCVIDGTLVTPNLDGTILRGITRRSIISYAKDNGYDVEIRGISVDELLYESERNLLDEAFVCGTAAVVCPVNEFLFNDVLIKTNYNIGVFTKNVYNYILDLQYGRIDHEWIEVIN